MTGGCDLIRLSLGAYALDALEPAERTPVETHLKCCADCRGELAQLNDVAGLLVNLPLWEVERAGIAAAVDHQGAGDEHKRQFQRARVRRAVVAVAAVAALVVTVLALAVPGDGDRSPTERVSLTASGRDRATHASALVMLHGQPGSTSATLSLHGVRPHLLCRLVVHALDGRSVIAATYRADNEGTADLTVRSAIPITDIASVEVRAGRNHRILQIPIHDSRSNA